MRTNRTNPTDPTPRLVEKIDELEKSLGRLEERSSDAAEEYAKVAAKLAKAEKQLTDFYMSDPTGTPPSDMKGNLDAAQKQEKQARSRMEGAEDRTDKVGAALEKFRQQLAEVQQKKQAEEDRQNSWQAKAGAAAGVLADVAGAGRAAAGMFTSYAGQLASYVQAFAPASVELFNLSLRDLTAVIGSALKPVLDAMTVVVKEVSSALLPVANALAPVMRTMAGVLVQLLTPALDTLAGVIQTLVPVFEVLAQIVAALTPLFRVSQALMAGWVEQFTVLLQAILPGKDGVKGFIEGFAEAIQGLSTAVLKVVAFIARALGATGFIDGMIKSLTGTMAKKQDATGLAAATGSAFTNISSFGQQVATRAFIAQGEAPQEKKTEAWLADIAGDLKGIRDGEGDLKTFLTSLVGRGLINLEGTIQNKLNEVVAAIKGKIYDSGKTVGWVLAPGAMAAGKLLGNGKKAE